jgi:hypothetical protein
MPHDLRGYSFRHPQRCCADFPRLAPVWAGQGYRGQAFIEWVRDNLDVQVEIVVRRDGGRRGTWVKA